MSQTEVQLIKNGAVVDADINGMSSSKLSGALPAISGASLTNLPTPTAKTRNLIINGAMQVAQRGTSSTSAGYQTVDRITVDVGGADESPTMAQADVASGTTPYTLGFRKTFKITNGNQTSVGTSDHIQVNYKIEAQDIANSGWDITNSSSNLTFSFWIKSSVSQFFTFSIRCKDGTEQVINFKTPVLSADTWTKVTKTIPGNSNLTVNNDNGQGFQIMLFPYIGTDYTTTGLAEDTWSAWSGTKHAMDNTSTWWTTNDATWELTGMQLEVGSVATDFEHRSFAQELALCQRYYFNVVQTSGTNEGFGIQGNVWQENNGSIMHIRYPVEMRTTPTFGSTNGTEYWRYFSGNDLGAAYLNGNGLVNNLTKFYGAEVYAFLNSGTGAIGRGMWIRGNNTAAKAYYDAEL